MQFCLVISELDGHHCPVFPDVYSYDEDDMVLDSKLPEHLSHFGIDMMTMEKVRFPVPAILSGRKPFSLFSISLSIKSILVFFLHLLVYCVDQVLVDRCTGRASALQSEHYKFSPTYWIFFPVGRHPDSYGWICLIEQTMITFYYRGVRNSAAALGSQLHLKN